MSKSKEVEYGDWSSLSPLEMAQEVLAWEDDRSALNRKYSQVLATEVERLNKAVEVMNAAIADDGQRERKLRAEIERLRGLPDVCKPCEQSKGCSHEECGDWKCVFCGSVMEHNHVDCISRCVKTNCRGHGCHIPHEVFIEQNRLKAENTELRKEAFGKIPDDQKICCIHDAVQPEYSGEWLDIGHGVCPRCTKDAKLGRMVESLPSGVLVERHPDGWSIDFMASRRTGETLTEALKAAGVKAC